MESNSSNPYKDCLVNEERRLIDERTNVGTVEKKKIAIHMAQSNSDNHTKELDLGTKTPKPIQPILSAYPCTGLGKDRRCFQPQWYKSFTWIEYSITRNAIFCFPCRNFPTQPQKGYLFVIGYQKFRKVKEFLTAHGETNGHATNVILWNHFKQSLIEGTIKEKFVALTKSEIMPPGNAHYCSPPLQNQMLSAAGNIILKYIASEIREAGYFDVMADDTRDVSSYEQFCICVRYVDKTNTPKEFFISFEKVVDLNAESLTKTLISTLNNNSINAICVAQAYDGASVMKGHLSGVQEKYRKNHKMAIYAHCYAHKLNLVLISACKYLPQSRKTNIGENRASWRNFCQNHHSSENNDHIRSYKIPIDTLNIYL
ncbi:uncharacterized protein LOC135926889 [Gordionus sp. m RMFG-2023]|uniref:uncharacterized protein LOC135926889 n=1 Tax=Gordionus sp. m RMFG-2023 TaxID=3053472 RepID=UPI0031FD5FDA